MKRQILMLLLAVFTIISSFVNAQTPYDNYAPEQVGKEMLQLPKTQFQVKNMDMSDSVQYAVFDENNMMLTLFRNDKSIIEAIKIKPFNSKFSTIDRFAEKFPWQSPYCYASNNPVKFIDVNGDSTAVLNMGSGNGEHTAMLVQNDKGKWQYYSLNGDWVYKLTDGLVGGKPYADLGTKTFDSPQDFLQSSYNAKGDEKQINDNTVNGYAFSEAFILPTTLEQDTQIRNTFIDAVNDGYGLISNQCAQSVQKALNSAGVETAVTVTRTVTDRQHGDIYQVTTKSNSYLPSTTFNSIIKNNPSGLYIRRR